MNRLLIVLLIVLPIPLLPSFAGAQSYGTDDQQSGGTYPTELQGAGTNTINPSKNPKIGELPKPQFTEELHIASQTQRETRPNYFVLDGYVDISTKGLRLQADHAEYDTQTQMLTARGNVVLDQEDSRITGSRIEMNLDTKKGSVYEVFGYVPPQIFFWGSRLDKTGEDEYKLYDAVFTECSQIKPHWKVKTSSTRMTFNEYVHFRDFTMKLKDLPVFYSPYMMWPIRRDRASGFLFPGFGPNSRKGFYFGDSFFWAMTRSMDTTLTVEHWALRGWGGGAEYRIATGEKSGGTVNYYHMDDQELGPQWSFSGEVNQDLPWDFRLAGVADLFSSFEYIQQFDNSFSGSARRSERGQAFLTRNWSYYSLNVLNDWSNTQFSRVRFVRLSHLPEVQFQSRSQQLLGTPIFWSLDTSFSELGRGDAFGQNDLAFSYQRYDLFPTISYPFNYLSWMTITPTFGYRITRYGDSQYDVTSANVPILRGEPVTRKYADFTLDLRGPNFGKIFDTPNMKYSQKWKHAIEPEVTYQYIQNIDVLTRVLRIDDIDDVRGLNVVTYSITNLLYAKRPIEEQEEYKPYEYQYYNPKPLEPPVQAPWEFISWKLAQTYYLDSDSYSPQQNPFASRFSPISSVVRVNPTSSYNVEFRMDYDMKYKQITDISIGSTLRDEDKWYGNLSYSRTNDAPAPGARLQAASHQIRANAGYGIYNNRYVFTGELDFDILNQNLLHHAIGFQYHDDCFAIGFEWRHTLRDLVFVGGHENQFTVTFSIPTIGNLVNFRNSNPPRKF
ncbi:MAG TPA: LPS assembly protein LptD [Acidobacteriota bacterium]|nr:LPS assembly protein LptD [Acidobacteriota bacterium]